jgi:hypothetical protein
MYGVIHLFLLPFENIVKNGRELDEEGLNKMLSGA